MKLFPKVLLIIGLLLFIICFAIPNNYSDCHSDFSVAGFTNRQSCLPDFVYQLDEVSFYVGIICIFAAFVLKEEREAEVTIFDNK